MVDQKLWGLLKRQKVDGIVLKKATVAKVTQKRTFAKVDAAPRCLKPQRWQIGRRNRIWGDRQGNWLGTKGATGVQTLPSPLCCFCRPVGGGESSTWAQESGQWPECLKTLRMSWEAPYPQNNEKWWVDTWPIGSSQASAARPQQIIPGQNSKTSNTQSHQAPEEGQDQRRS